MPKLNAGRTTRAEANLARRISHVRLQRQQSHEALAESMTKAGCAITGSSIYRIENGDPPRRISVDELVTLAKVWDLSIEELLTPVELIEQREAQQISEQLPLLWERFEDSLIECMRLSRDFWKLAGDSEELREYMRNQMDAVLAKHADSDRHGVDLPHVTDEELFDFRTKVQVLWATAEWLGAESAHREADPSRRPSEKKEG